MDVIIRKARLKDVSGITRLWQQLIGCHQNVCGYDKPLFAHKKNALSIYRKYITKCIRSRNSLVLVAESDNALVGFVEAAIGKLPDIYLHDRELRILGIYVDENFRRKGISRKFFSEVAKWGKKKKVYSLGLMCSVHNENAHRSYSKIGFEEHHWKMSKVI